MLYQFHSRRPVRKHHVSPFLGFFEVRLCFHLDQSQAASLRNGTLKNFGAAAVSLRLKRGRRQRKIARLIRKAFRTPTSAGETAPTVIPWLPVALAVKDVRTVTVETAQNGDYPYARFVPSFHAHR